MKFIILALIGLAGRSKIIIKLKYNAFAISIKK